MSSSFVKENIYYISVGNRHKVLKDFFSFLEKKGAC